jgi:hypothetical protein
MAQPTPTTFLFVGTIFGGKSDREKRHILFVAVGLGVFEVVVFGYIIFIDTKVRGI